MQTRQDTSNTFYPALQQQAEELSLVAWIVDWRSVEDFTGPVCGRTVIAAFPDHGLARLSAILGAAMADAADGTILEIAPGALALKSFGKSSGGAAGLLAAAFLPGYFDADPTPLSDTASLRSLCHPDAPSARRALRALQWNFDAAGLRERDRAAMNGLSQKLERSYEEINLVYRLAGTLKVGTNLCAKLDLVLSDVLQTMPFGWMSIYFSQNSPFTHAELQGFSNAVGTPNVAVAILKRASRQLIEAWPHKSGSRSLSGGEIPSECHGSGEILGVPVTHDGHIVGILLAGSKGADLSSEDFQIMDVVAQMLGAFHENATRYNAQRTMLMQTIQALGHTLEAKDPYTRGHSERVAHLAAKLARRLGLSTEEIDSLRLAGLVHDLGKIGVPEAVLRKAGRLTDEEFAQMKLHPVVGHRILKDIPTMEGILPAVLHHHERWDGGGYPSGLAAGQIPFNARILALADSFDAMSSNRAYRAAMPRMRVLHEILRGGGSQFDPELVAAFAAMDFEDFDALLKVQRTNTAA